MTTPEALQEASNQTPLILMDCLGFGLLGLLLLFLGAIARGLRSGISLKSLCGNSRMWGNFIAVFFVVCVPVVWLAAAQYRDTVGVMVFATFIPPIFSAGLALEEHAEQIIKNAQQGNAGKTKDRG